MTKINIKKYVSYTAFFLLLNCSFFNSTQHDGFPILKGPYLGQKPPSMIPEVFAPGIISKTGNHLHSCVSFSPDGKEVYFTYMVFDSVRQGTIYYLKQVGNRWTKRQVAPFSGVYSDDSPAFSPDGKRLYFCVGIYQRLLFKSENYG